MTDEMIEAIRICASVVREAYPTESGRVDYREAADRADRAATLSDEMLDRLRRVSDFASAHHAGQPIHNLLHALTVDIPAMCELERSAVAVGYSGDFARRPVVARAFIQWKGTDVCLDAVCPDCGNHGHVHGMFVYFLKCSQCGAVLEMQPYIALHRPVSGEDQVEPDGGNTTVF